MTNSLNPEEQQILLETARKAIRQAFQDEKKLALNLEKYPLSLQEKGACFITLRKKGALRGCVGSIEAVQPLILDVRDRAVAAALQDYRFSPLTLPELNDVQIEISRLTSPTRLEYKTADDLISKLQPGVDGVVLKYHSRRATFLPQVWEQLPTPEIFLNRLCLKMGLEESVWKQGKLQVEIYQVERFQEQD
jgi:AmmeMemoRadiSam system protein A